MTSDQSRLVEELYHAAVKLDPSLRAGFLDGTCAANPALRKEVESLIASNQQASKEHFLADESPIAVRLSEMLIDRVLDDKYRIEKLLGEGGMGAVYLATHLGTGRPVALKVIAPQFMGEGEFIERFRREAKAAGLLRHPNVVNVTDFGFAEAGSDNVAYLVMEYLDGSTLGDLLKEKGRFQLRFVVDVVEQISFALDEAHKHGVIHRDLKPDNIWLEPNRRGGYNVKVLDFGIAKLRDPAPPQFADHTATLPTEYSQSAPSAVTDLFPTAFASESPLTAEAAAPMAKNATRQLNLGSTDGSIDSQTIRQWRTRAGTVLGTPLYMSPEQCLGNELDARSDIYSLGVITYQMLTGETPFTGDLFEIIQKRNVLPPRPVRVNRRDIPKAVAEVVMSAISTTAADRQTSAGAFAGALRTTAEGAGPILKEAADFRRLHRGLFVRMSSLIFLPVIAIISLMIYGVAFGTQGPRRPLVYLFWVVSITLMLVASRLNTVACSIVVEHLRTQSHDEVELRVVFRDWWQRASLLEYMRPVGYFKLFVETTKVIAPSLKAYRGYSFYPIVVMLEGKGGKAAIERAANLMQPVRSIVLPLLARDAFAVIVGLSAILLLAILSSVTLSQWQMLSSFFPGSGDLLPSIALLLFLEIIILFVLLSVIMLHSITGTAVAVLYGKARQILGEPIEHSAKSHYEIKDIPSTRAQNKLTFAYLGAILFAVLAWTTVLSFASLPNDPGPGATVSRMLLAIGASPNPKRWDSPLYGRDLGLVKASIAAGADINAIDNEGLTPLMKATSWPSPEKVRVLIAAGADANVKDKNGNTTLLLLAKRSPWLTHPELDCVRALIAGGANVNAIDTKGKSALMYAARQAELVKMLIESGADLNLRDEEGRTALMYAAITDPPISTDGGIRAQSLRSALGLPDPDANAAIITMLIDARADVNLMDHSGKTVLFYVEDEPATRLLIAAGADLNAKDSYQGTALAHAKKHGRTGILILLQKAGAHE